MKLERVLIVGAGGFIGSYLYEHLSREKGREVVGTYNSRHVIGGLALDVLDLAAMRMIIAQLRPSVVVLLAGTKDVERCESDPHHAVKLNYHAVRHFVESCEAADIAPYTIFISSDYVFDGRAGFFGEKSRVGPNTVYGVTKVLAERLLLRSGLPGVILRMSAVMGRRGGFFRFLERGLAESNELALFDNTWFSPTSIGRVCAFVEGCINAASEVRCAPMRISHLSDGYRMTRYDFGCAVALRQGKSLSNIVACKADLTKSTFQADLSLLPDGASEFLPSSRWDDLLVY